MRASHGASEPGGLTAEQAFELAATNRRFELRRGEYVAMSPAGGQHGEIANTIAYLITEHVRKSDLGRVMAAETGFVLARDPDTVRAADVAFVSRDRVPPEGVPVGFWPMAPDLAVEVVSPNDRPEDIQEKVEEYLAAGTKLVGVVYPKTQSVTVYRSLREIVVLREDDLITGDEVLPGFACPVRKLLE